MGRFRISKGFSFAAAHSIRGHPGECQRLHGHTYRVRVHLEAERLDELGMVVDFAELKAAMAEIVAPYDHRVINEVPPFDERNTTAELLAEHFFRGLDERFDDERVRVVRVEVWESDSSCAAFEAG